MPSSIGNVYISVVCCRSTLIMLLDCRRRRHIIRIVVLFIVACIVVLCFQLFLFGAISGYHDEHVSSGWFDRGARPKYLEDDTHLQGVVQRNVADIKMRFSRTTTGCDGNNCSETEQVHSVGNHKNHVSDEPTLFDMPPALVNRNVGALGQDTTVNTQSFTDVWRYLEFNFPLNAEQVANGTNVLGASSRWKRAYLPDANGFFTCILSKVIQMLDVLCFFNKPLFVCHV
jgi:hypothetical protein